MSTLDKCESVFHELDADGSGALEMDEVAAGFAKLGMGCEDQQELLQKLVAEADTDGNGKVELNEFVSMVSRLLGGGEGTALALVAEYRKWSEFFVAAGLGVPRLPPPKQAVEPAAPQRSAFWQVSDGLPELESAAWQVALGWADSVFRTGAHEEVAGRFSPAMLRHFGGAPQAVDWCRAVGGGVGQGLAVTAVGTAKDGGCALLVQGTKSRALCVLWCSDGQISGVMAYGDPGSATMADRDKSGEPITVIAQREVISLKGLPLTVKDWSTTVAEKLIAHDHAWIYSQFSEGFWNAGPREFEKFMAHVGRITAVASIAVDGYKVTTVCTVVALCTFSQKPLEWYYCNGQVTGLSLRPSTVSDGGGSELKNPPQGYGVYLADETSVQHGRLHCELQEGQEAVFAWTRPPDTNSWVQYDYSVPNTFLSSNGDECIELLHAGVASTAVNTGDVAGCAMKATGPCHIQCEYAFTHRPRRVEVRDPSRPPGFYLAVPPPPPAPSATAPHGAATTSVPGAGDAHIYACPNIGDKAVWERWLQDGELHSKRADESDVYFAFRTLSHMAKTLVYAADPVTMNSKRSDVATILSWGKTDCGGHTMTFKAVMATHGIPCRSILLDMHIFPEIYVQGCGWVPCEATMKDPGQLGQSDAAGHAVMVGASHRLDLSPFTGALGAPELVQRFIACMYVKKDVDGVWDMLAQGMKDHFKNDKAWLKQTGPDQGEYLQTNCDRFHPGGAHAMVEVAVATGNHILWTLYSDGSGLICGMLAAFNRSPSAKLDAPDASWDGDAVLGQDIAGQRPSVVVLKGGASFNPIWRFEDVKNAPGVIGPHAQDKFLAGWADKGSSFVAA
mmetsp:Transcript_6032/g.10975  ORF Transcript_6032/g.10975 Transcript_6032/m.10975 type:complete len:845 (-) Transcript_6032:95-2629(-)|eukprot:CAMPEP_0182521088 /NCGR_PEP_ID=MMETSP1321-20130603/45945_1 /TAXON_ID=91990 /ORGANISM="Bolidomonas sp., Strain RCC1657" /LENGTH=844 /DNA_ID=CAMNT_0024729113 /DNA_START=1273 /DNA_END=3807 /DNA_ORIENTATION=+